MIKILTNYYSDLVNEKSFVAGIKSQQYQFRNFMNEKQNYKLVGIFAAESKGPEEFHVSQKGEGFYEISWPKFYLKSQLKKCKSIDEVNQRFERIIKMMEKVIIDENINVVLLNGFLLFHACIWLAAKRHNISIVYIHSGLTHKESLLNRWLASTKELDILIEVEKKLAQESFCDVFLSDFSKKTYENEVLKKAIENSAVIPAPIGREFLFAERKPKKSRGALIRVGLVGRWDPIKNHQSFLKIAKYARANKLPMEFFCVTRFPDKQNTADLMEIGAEYKKYITILEPMPAQELIDFYRDMNVVVCPSFFETLNKTVIESLLCGTPAITSPTTGAAEVFEKLGLDSWIDDFSQTEESAEKIQRVARMDVPERVIARLKSNYSPEVIFEQYLKIINSAVSGSKAVLG